MKSCRLALRSGETVEVRGELEAVIEELHKVATRREHTFAVLQDPSGDSIAIQPDAVLYVRPAKPADDAAAPA